MAIFLPILLFAGAAAISLFADGCAPPSPSPPPKPLDPPPFPPDFAKSYLEFRQLDGTLGEGYQSLLSELERQVLAAKPGALSTNAFLMPGIFSDPRQVAKAKAFVGRLAAHDEKPEDISLFDIYCETKRLYGEEWKGEWRDRFLGPDFKLSLQERLRAVGEPLRAGILANPAPARELLSGLAFYVGLLNPSQADSRLGSTLDFYLNGIEAPVFSRYLKTPYPRFLQMSASEQSETFKQALSGGFPDLATTQGLVDQLSPVEAQRFIQECLRRDPRASLELFEKVRLPAGGEMPKVFEESDFFPKLPQDLPYAQRQKAIDDFLPPPEKTLKRGAVTLRKYRWVGDTEVFSLESKNPGPTTLVFAPHFHENNPRKAFHWLKDLPLQSGRVLLLPEANAAMARSKQSTHPMNSIFNKAFHSDRVDHLVVRRTEWLMGLCDGMIGLHDWQQHAPFFISDAVVDAQGSADPSLSPVASPWISSEARKIQRLSHAMTLDQVLESVDPDEAVKATFKNGVQVQWQMAEAAALRLEKLSGRNFAFSATPLAQRDSYRIDNATAYMNYFLKKPAMTFEGTAEEEQGQLAAQAVYSLLLAYGHRVDAAFEKKLKDPNPSVEPDLYVGLPPGLPPPPP